MARILMLETSDDVAGIVRSTLSRLGHDVVVVGTSQRMRLELRAGSAALLIGAMDLKHGSGLDLVRDAAVETSEPVPVLVLSKSVPAVDIARDAPVELLLAGVLDSPPRAQALVRFVSAVVPGTDPQEQERLLEALARESLEARAGAGMPDTPVQIGQQSVALLLAQADRLGWTGCLRVSSGAEEPVNCWITGGQLAAVGIEGQGALLKTAQLAGSLDGAKVPDVVFNNEEEEVGLLLALRAVAMHQVDQLKAQTRSRLLSEILGANDGQVHCQADASVPVGSGPAQDLLPILLSARRDGVLASSGGQGRDDSPLWLSLPARAPQRSGRQDGDDQRLLSGLRDPASRDAVFGDVVDALVAAGGEQEDVLAALSFLRDLGYLDYVPTLFDAETSERLAAMVQELHRQHGADHYKVLGLDGKVSEKELKKAMRQLSRLYHPDSLFGVHPRIVATAAAIYGRIQEAYEVLGDNELRRDYLDARKEAGGAEGGSAKDRDRGKVSFAQARILMKNKKYARARDAYRDATLHDSNSFEARLMLGWSRFLADHDDHEAAFSDLEQARGMGVNPGEALYYMGRIRLLQKDFPGARKWFEKAAGASLNGHANASRELRLMDQRGQAPSADEAAEETTKPRGLFSRLRRN